MVDILVMSLSMPLLALAGRILTLGVERIIVKQLGSRADALCATFLFFFLGALFLLPVVLYQHVDLWSIPSHAFVSGLFYAVAFVCYVRSLSLEDASLVSPLYNCNIIFLALIAFVFLDEPLSMFKGLGLALLLYGASWLNQTSSRQTSWLQSVLALLRNTGCQYMIAASLLIAVGRVIDKSNIQAASPLIYCLFLYVIIAAYVFVYIVIKRRTSGILRIMKEQPLTALSSGAINAYSYLFLLVAMTAIDVSVAEPVSMLGMVVTLLLSQWWLGEKVGRRWIAVCIMLGGAGCLVMDAGGMF